MKKILSFIICTIMLLSVFPDAYAFSADNVEITTNVSKITVKVTAPTDGAMTALVVNADHNTLYGMDEENAPVSENGEYIYTFNFKMQYNVPTDTYKVVLGGNVAHTEKDFSYVNINDKITFYTNLDTTIASGIKQYFADNPTFVPVDLTVYNNLDTDVLSLVNEKIDILALNPGVLPEDSDEEKQLKVTEKDNLFQSSFAEIMGVAEIATADEAKLTETIENGIFNGYFYNEENVGSAVLNVSEVIGPYKAEAKKVTELEIANYVKAFDDATLLTVEKVKDYTTLKKAFLYYAENSMLTPAPDMTNINMLLSANKDTDLWKELLRADNTDVSVLVANAEAIARDMIENGTLTQQPSAPGSGIGGGTGGGGGGGSISKPTTPGASTGIVNKPQEETTVKTFSDLKDAEWAREAVETLAAQGAINGKSATKFAPNESMTREEFVKVLIGAFELTDNDAKCEFSDISSERWSYKYIASARRIGLVAGDGEKFNPTATISRQDMAVIIYRLFELSDTEIMGTKVNFSDEAFISDYAKKAVEALSGAKIINGMGDGTFSPKTAVTRAQAAKVIYELKKTVGGEN